MARPREHDQPGTPVRERVLSAAIKLFNRKGYAGTTVREIVTEAGVTKPVLYYYFGNKEGIYRELMAPPFEAFEEMLLPFKRKQGTARELLLELCSKSIELFTHHIEVARIMYSIYYGPPQGAPHIDFHQYHARLRETVRHLIRKGMQSGEFCRANLEHTTWAVMGAITIAMEVQLSHPEEGLGPRGLKGVLDTILRGVER